MLGGLNIFHQRKPRSFHYRPRYWREEREENPASGDHAQRIRSAYRAEDPTSGLRHRMESRRLLASLDNSRGKAKLIRWVVLGALALMAYYSLAFIR
ncbi:MAG: hypothetical protein N2050_05495 [Flavobacteriales bacterium]|nr:hypothetical protein [Flavobacteriales bacterium]MCX7649990.1 hypothetical protein [Flavobacteriales bacterium]MDW8433148.1 hypothetical protein [Flavobacteriales bacterium]